MTKKQANAATRRHRPLRVEQLDARQLFASLSDLANDPHIDRQYYLDQISAPQVWSETTGQGVIVAVIDSGVDLENRDLVNQLWTNEREIPGNNRDDDGNGLLDDYHGYNFGEDKPDPQDRKGHGTHMAGIIAAERNNGIGISGVAPDATILPIRISRRVSGHDLINWEAAIKAINYVTDLRVDRGENIRVIAFSGVTPKANLPGTPLPALRDAIERAGRAGILFVTSAGNYNVDNDRMVPYPSSYEADNIISVAASTNQDKYWRSSNYGETTVDLAAPGSRIASTYPNRTTPVTKSGTSFSAPQVAAVAALAFAHKPDATAAEVKQAILDGVDSMNDARKETVTDGRLNAKRTIEILSGIARPTTPSTPTTTPVDTSPPPIQTPNPLTPTTSNDETAEVRRATRSKIEAPRRVGSAGPVSVRLTSRIDGRTEGLGGKKLTLYLRIPQGRRGYFLQPISVATTRGDGTAEFSLFTPLDSSRRFVFEVHFEGDTTAFASQSTIIAQRR